MRHHLLTVIAIASIAGCATGPQYKLVKNAPQHQIDQDNAYCRSQADLIQTPEWAYRGTFMEGASIVNRQQVALENCLIAKGYTKQDARQREVDQGVTDRMGYLKERADEICTKPEYQQIFEKTTCGKQQMTLAMLSDNSKPSKSQKLLLQKYWKELQSVSEERGLIIESSRDTKAKEYDSYFKSNIVPASLISNSDLISGKVTWGTFNKEKLRINTLNSNKFEEIKNR